MGLISDLIASQSNCQTGICYTPNSRKTKGYIDALGLIVGVRVPKIGETVDIYDAAESDFTKATVLTTDNYAKSLFYWQKLQMMKCFDGKGFGMFFNKGGSIWRGKQGKFEKVLDENPSEFDRDIVGWKGTSEYSLPSLIGNICWANSFQNSKDITVINYLNNAVQILDASKIANRVEDWGVMFDKGDQVESTGELKIRHQTKDENQPCLHFWGKNEADFEKELSKLIQFTFNPDVTGAIVQSGLTAGACKGGCAGFTVDFGTAFDITYKPLELLTGSAITPCGKYELYKNCGELLDTALLSHLTIDELTGKITGLATLPKATYKLKVGFGNECCIAGTGCLTIIVK